MTEEIVMQIAAFATIAGGLAYTAVAIVKGIIRTKGWIISLIALGFCILEAWGFWVWHGRQQIVMGVFAVVLAWGTATGVDRGAGLFRKKGE